MLVPLTWSFAGGLLLGSFLSTVPCTVLFLLIALAVFLTFSERRLPATHALILFGTVLAGLLYWTVYTSVAYSPPFAEPSDAPERVSGIVSEPPRHAPNRVALVLSAFREEGGERRPVGRLRLTWREPDRAILQGERVSATARLRPPGGVRNPGGFDYSGYLTRHGIDAVASVSGGGQVLIQERPPALSWRGLWHILDGWRDRIRRAAELSLTGPALGLYLGMIIGEPDFVGPDVRDLFMATGTVHILSISGSHLGLIALLLFGMFSMIFRGLPTPWLLSLSRHITPMRVAAVATAFAVTWYALLAGAQIATMRSLVMLLIFLTAVWLGRGHSVLRAWAAAVLVVLLHDPRALFDISFQFSYLSVLAIALVLHWNEADKADELPLPWQERAKGWGRDYLLITGAVTLVTFPLAAYYFNQMAWLGLIANLVIVPLAGFVFVPAGLLSALWLLIGGGEALPGAAVHEALGSAMVKVVTLLAAVPEATRHVASPGIPAIAVFFFALYMACRPGGSRPPRIAAALVAVALVSWWTVSPRVWSDGDTVRVTFLDVGQGDACVIELPDGHTVLIDGGTAQESLDMGRAVVAPYLWDRGITRLDHVIATHPQLDHIGGLAAVLRSFEVGRYWSNGVRRDEAFYRRVQDNLTARGVTEDIAEAGRVILQTETCRLLVLNPPREPLVPVTAGPAPAWTHYSGSGTELNNRSVVTRLDCGAHSFLFTADIERAALSRLRSASRLLAAHVLKVPHHGAHSSWEAGWGHAVGSAISVISVGKHNAYGHPSPAVLAGYSDDGSRVLRTDEEGAIWVTARLSSPAFEIHSVRQHRLIPVVFGPTMLTDEWANLRRLWAHWREA